MMRSEVGFGIMERILLNLKMIRSVKEYELRRYDEYSVYGMKRIRENVLNGSFIRIEETQ